LSVVDQHDVAAIHVFERIMGEEILDETTDPILVVGWPGFM